MSGLIFRHTHRVTYGECTIGNHVYYARYLDILESARGEFFRALLQSFLTWQEKDTIFPVIDCRLRFKGAASYDDLLGIDLRLSRLEHIRVNFTYRIFNQTGRVLVEATTDHVCANLKSKPKRIPAELDCALRPYLDEHGGNSFT